MMMFWIGNVSGNGYSDYYPFGMQMPDRNDAVNSYRYGFNGMEGDSEMKGSGNSYTTEFRQYDPRLGRWLSLDPMMNSIPEMTPYNSMENNPIYHSDPRGNVVILRNWNKRNQRVLLMDLSKVTGLKLKVVNGKLTYERNSDGTPRIIAKHYSYNKGKFSITARNRLIAMIDDAWDMVHVSGDTENETSYLINEDWTDESGSRHSYSNVNPAQVSLLKSKYHGDGDATGNTVGFAMAFFHETDHQFWQSMDEVNMYNPDGLPLNSTMIGTYQDGTGRSAAAFVNEIRFEIGFDIRLAYLIVIDNDVAVVPFCKAKACTNPQNIYEHGPTQNQINNLEAAAQKGKPSPPYVKFSISEYRGLAKANRKADKKESKQKKKTSPRFV